jgi:hypothetical protein
MEQDCEAPREQRCPGGELESRLRRVYERRRATDWHDQTENTRRRRKAELEYCGTAGEAQN